MKRILINESEKQRILNMHKIAVLNEQNPFSDLATSQNNSIEKSNINNRFGEEIFNQVKEVANNKGLSQVNNIQDDNSFYLWSKDLGGENKVMLFLYNGNNNNPASAGIMTYVDRNDGKAYTMQSGRWSKSSNLGMGIYPSEANVYRVSTKLFNTNALSSEIDKISKAFQSTPKQNQQPNNTNTETKSTGAIKTLADNKSTFKYYVLDKNTSKLTSLDKTLNTTTKIENWNFKDQDTTQSVYVEKIEGNKVTLTNTSGSAVVTINE